MSDQSKLGLGHIITTEQNRDAIHIAVAPVVAAYTLRPGQHVGLDDRGEANYLEKDLIGVVDPFLLKNVKKGQTFWLYLYPGSITSLRHEWTHPAFTDNAPSPLPTASEIWVRQFASRVGHPYETVLDRVGSNLRGESSWAGDDDDADRYNDELPLLLTHCAIILGIAPPEDPDTHYFSCAC